MAIITPVWGSDLYKARDPYDTRHNRVCDVHTILGEMEHQGWSVLNENPENPVKGQCIVHVDTHDLTDSISVKTFPRPGKYVVG